MSLTTAVVADLGGTHSRFALATRDEQGAIHLAHAITMESRSSASLDPLIHAYRAQLPAEAASIAAFGLAVAGPVANGKCVATNLPWVLDAEALRASLQATHVALMNDFEAVAWGVRETPTDLLETLQSGRFQASAPLAVIGAGTGLGEALATLGERFVVMPTEGGHADFAARDPFEDGLLAMLRLRFPEHVSVERIVSGPGIAAILEHALATQRHALLAADVARYEAMLAKEEPARDVVEGASLGDALCGAVLDRFVDLYGAEAGNFALKSLPRAGLYIAGGLATRMMTRVRARFLAAFLAKGRMRGVLHDVPVHVVLDPQVGLRGAAARVFAEMRGNYSFGGESR